jgi:Tfp pilus assembly protein PilF
MKVVKLLMLLMCMSTITWAQKPVKYQVLFGNKALPKKDKLELDQFISSCDASFPSRKEAANFFAERAWEFVAAGKLDTATYRFNLVNALDTASIDAFWGLGVISFQRKDYSLAKQLLTKGLISDPTQAFMRVDYAIVLLSCYIGGMDCGTLAEADAELAQALKDEPKNAAAWMKRSQVAYYQEKYELAWTYFHECRTLDMLQMDLNFGSQLAEKMPDPKGIFK